MEEKKGSSLVDLQAVHVLEMGFQRLLGYVIEVGRNSRDAPKNNSLYGCALALGLFFFLDVDPIQSDAVVCLQVCPDFLVIYGEWIGVACRRADKFEMDVGRVVRFAGSY